MAIWLYGLHFFDLHDSCFDLSRELDSSSRQLGGETIRQRICLSYLGVRLPSKAVAQILYAEQMNGPDVATSALPRMSVLCKLELKKVHSDRI